MQPGVVKHWTQQLRIPEMLGYEVVVVPMPIVPKEI